MLILDEMKIQEDLVFYRTGQQLHGFVNLGDVNEDLESEVDQHSLPCKNIATHMLTLMVRGIFFKLELPYENFPTQGKSHSKIINSNKCHTCFILIHIGTTGQSLYWIMWEAVRRLEELNLKV